MSDIEKKLVVQRGLEPGLRQAEFKVSKPIGKYQNVLKSTKLVAKAGKTELDRFGFESSDRPHIERFFKEATCSVTSDTPKDTEVITPDKRRGVLNQEPAGKFAWVKFPPEKEGQKAVLKQYPNDKLIVVACHEKKIGEIAKKMDECFYKDNKGHVGKCGSGEDLHSLVQNADKLLKQMPILRPEERD